MHICIFFKKNHIITPLFAIDEPGGGGGGLDKGCCEVLDDEKLACCWYLSSILSHDNVHSLFTFCQVVGSKNTYTPRSTPLAEVRRNV